MPQTDIVLAAITARYSHTAFGLRWLYANLGGLRDRAALLEFPLGEPPLHIAEAILKHEARVVALSVHIWNLEPATQVVQTLKAVAPQVAVIIGGPEVSYEYEEEPIFAAADFLVRGEGEQVFPQLAAELLAGRRPTGKVRTGHVDDLAALALPYADYSDQDIAHRMLYVETTRGCPFRCAFCLSALAGGVRRHDLDAFLDAMDDLLKRGARTLRFVDRTFNLDIRRVERILAFFRERWREGMQLHFEIVPGRVSGRLLEAFAAFPPGGLHLEAGVQSFHEPALAAIDRRQDTERTLQVLHDLREMGALIHADLVAGLPGETWTTFAAGFDALIDARPQEVQAGILKRLKGSPLAQRADDFGLAFAKQPPYEILQTPTLSFQELQELRRFARYFDLYYNSGNFPRSMELLWRGGGSAFEAFHSLSHRVWRATGRTHKLALYRLAEYLYAELAAQGVETGEAEEAVLADFHRLPGRKERLRIGTPAQPD